MSYRILATRVFAPAVAVCCLVSAAPAWAVAISVPAGGDLQGALNAAQPGDLILLAPGATYTGNFKLPVTPDGSFITVRTDAAAGQLPSPGTRVAPQHAAVLAKIKSPNTAAALATVDGAHHWRFENVEFQANVNGAGDIILLGSSSQTQLSQVPHHLVFDRVYIHGDPVAGQKRGIALNCGTAEVINSYISDIKAVGVDSQAIAGWNGTGPYLIQNNYLEGAGENVMFGGSDPTMSGLVPSDITIRNNLFSKPLEWRTSKWQIKNAFELKNARRVLIEGNVFENVWAAAQAGFAILFSTRNQDGKALWSIVEDVTFQYNVVRHAANAINISGYDDKYASQQGRRYRIAHNVIYDIDAARWGGSGIFLQIGNEPRDIVVEHNTVMHTGTALNVYGGRIDGLRFRDNLMRHNEYGVKGSGAGSGQTTLSAFFANWVFEGNALAGGDGSKYPAGNYFPSSDEFEASFANAAAGDFTLVSGSAFRGAASDGGSLGADVRSVDAALRGGPPPAGADQGYAVCRPGSGCTDRTPFPGRRR